MTRFVVYDAEVAARMAQAVGSHRIELRESHPATREIDPVLLEAITSPRQNAILMPSSDEQVLLVRISDGRSEDSSKGKIQRKRKTAEIHEIGSRPSGFLGLHDEAKFDNEDEDPPRILWKKKNDEH